MQRNVYSIYPLWKHNMYKRIYASIRIDTSAPVHRLWVLGHVRVFISRVFLRWMCIPFILKNQVKIEKKKKQRKAEKRNESPTSPDFLYRLLSHRVT